MTKPEKYILIGWPEIQDFMEDPEFSKCVFCTEISGHPCPDSTYAVPESLYYKVKDTVDIVSKNQEKLSNTLAAKIDEYTSNIKSLQEQLDKASKCYEKIIFNNENISENGETLFKKVEEKYNEIVYYKHRINNFNVRLEWALNIQKGLKAYKDP